MFLGIRKPASELLTLLFCLLHVAPQIQLFLGEKITANLFQTTQK
jgi:hypothetical protein